MKKADLKILLNILEESIEKDWVHLYKNHFIFGCKQLILSRKQDDSRYRFNVIYHMNAIIEGSLKLLSRSRKDTEEKTMQWFIDKFSSKKIKIIPADLRERIILYKNTVRNYYTHEPFDIPSEKICENAIEEAYFFLIVFYKLSISKFPLDDQEIMIAIVSGFLESFKLSSKTILEKSNQTLEELQEELIVYHNNSIFKNFFWLEQTRTKLGSFLELSFSSPTGMILDGCIIRINRIRDFPIAYGQVYVKLKRDFEKFQSKYGKKAFFVIIIYLKRPRLIDLVNDFLNEGIRVIAIKSY